jgi:hypothetical protein
VNLDGLQEVEEETPPPPEDPPNPPPPLFIYPFILFVYKF